MVLVYAHHWLPVAHSSTITAAKMPITIKYHGLFRKYGKERKIKPKKVMNKASKKVERRSIACDIDSPLGR